MIEVRGFSFGIGGKEILRDVDLSIKTGEYVSIVGPNGAGKTTLLRCLDKIYVGGRGTIEINGKSTESFSQAELAKLVGYVPQADGSQFPFTVHEFIMMGRYPHLSPFSSIGKGDEEAVQEAMARTGTREFVDRLLSTLSSGERQKVFIAAALAQEAKILLLDEPTTFLDYRHQVEIQKLLKRINRRSSVTMVSVTHDINYAALASDRIAAMKSGSIVFCGKPEEAMRNDILEKIYDRPFIFAKHPRTGFNIVVPEEIDE
jgi:iron complex transport system ATP-binding protein